MLNYLESGLIQEGVKSYGLMSVGFSTQPERTQKGSGRSGDVIMSIPKLNAPHERHNPQISVHLGPVFPS